MKNEFCPAHATPIVSFGNHPDLSTDFCMEVDKLEGWIEDIKAGVRPQWPFWGRLSRLLWFARQTDFTNLDAIANRARPIVFEMEHRLLQSEHTP